MPLLCMEEEIGNCWGLLVFFSKSPFWLLASYTVDFYIGSSPGPTWHMGPSLVWWLHNNRSSQN